MKRVEKEMRKETVHRRNAHQQQQQQHEEQQHEEHVQEMKGRTKGDAGASSSSLPLPTSSLKTAAPGSSSRPHPPQAGWDSDSDSDSSPTIGLSVQAGFGLLSRPSAFPAHQHDYNFNYDYDGAEPNALSSPLRKPMRQDRKPILTKSQQVSRVECSRALSSHTHTHTYTHIPLPCRSNSSIQPHGCGCIGATSHPPTLVPVPWGRSKLLFGLLSVCPLSDNTDALSDRSSLWFSLSPFLLSILSFYRSRCATSSSRAGKLSRKTSVSLSARLPR